MILIYLFLAHFIADFLLQPNNLVAWKNQSWKGIAVHAIIHFLVTTLLLQIYLSTSAVFLISVPVALVHFVIDSVKASHERKFKHSFATYWIDQGLHYLTLIVFYLVLGKYVLSMSQPVSLSTISANLFDLYTTPAVLIFFNLAIFSTYTIEYSVYHDRQKIIKKRVVLDKKRMIKRLFIVSLIYIGLIFSFPIVGMF